MIKVLRLGHRRGRDDRISTHVGLTARQWGADEIVYSGEKDSSMVESIRDVVDRWGGDFEVRYTEEWKKLVRDFDGFTVVLSMFGEKLREGMPEFKEVDEDVLVIVGGEKVPSWLYEDVDLNLSVGNQPHSEVAALAVFLHEYFGDENLYREFDGAEIKVEPRRNGKEVIDLDQESK